VGDTASACVSADGDVYTWGWGGSFWQGNGGLGHGDNTSQPRPALVQSLEEAGTKVHSVAVGASHMLALTREGRVLSWGNGEYGRCGNGRREQLVPEPVELLAGTMSVAVAAGSQHSLALTAAGAVYAWGKNDAGQLGLVRGCEAGAAGARVRATAMRSEREGTWLALSTITRATAPLPRPSLPCIPAPLCRAQGGNMVMDLNTMEEFPLEVGLEVTPGDATAEDAKDFSALRECALDVVACVRARSQGLRRAPTAPPPPHLAPTHARATCRSAPHAAPRPLQTVTWWASRPAATTASPSRAAARCSSLAAASSCSRRP